MGRVGVKQGKGSRKGIEEGGEEKGSTGDIFKYINQKYVNIFITKNQYIYNEKA